MATFDLGRVTPIYRREYSATASYELNDVVLYEGNLYWHVQATATVGIAPTDTTVWKLAFADEGVRAEIRGYADNAQASKTAAAQSASQASASASSAQASASQAALSAQAASTKASEASTSAQTASTKASEASTSAQSAASSAQTATDKATLASQKAAAASESASLATAKANAAATSETNAAVSAQTATTKASEVAASATSAQEYDESAQQSAVNAQVAQELAEQARTAAETAQGLAEDARDDAQEIVDGINAKAEQIDTNTAEITELKSDLSTLNTEGTVHASEQMLSDNYTEDSVPYHFRKTASDNADREELEIVGGSVAWNQLNGKPNNVGSTTKNGVTAIWNSDKTWTLNGTATASGGFLIYYNGNIIPNNHKVLFGTADYKHNHVGVYQNGYSSDVDAKLNTNGGFALTSGGANIVINLFENETYTNEVVHPQIFDLTAMFGFTIADYIYDLETAHAGDGVAFFKSLFPNDYYEYNSGELVSVSGLSAHVMRDVDNNIIRSYPLDSTLTLRGIPKLDAQNNLYYDGDRYLPDGKVERRYGVVDLGTLSWEYNSTAEQFRAGISPTPAEGLGSKAFNAICTKYPIVSHLSLVSDQSLTDKTASIFYASVNGINIKDTSYTDAATFKAAMSGVMLVYKLATPTTESADPYVSPQICHYDGTEEFVSTGIVPVGHNTKYPDNLRMKLDNLPWNFASLIAPTESAFVATRNYVTGDLFIVSNVLYKATSNIANGGTITPNTNCTATTLAEIISALA